jgi:hypothetical protein
METNNLENLETVEETTDVEETEEILNEELEETTDSVEDDVVAEDDQIDYDSELEALKENRAKNFENAKKRVEAKGKNVDKEALIAEIKNELISDLQRDVIEEELSSISNDKKRELVKYHFEHSIVKSGSSRQSVREDMAKAVAIVEASVNAKRKSENLIAKNAKETVTTGSPTGGRPSTTAKEDLKRYLSPADLAFCEKRGWTKEMFERATAEIKSKK